jgi:hypothetical protein
MRMPPLRHSSQIEKGLTRALIIVPNQIFHGPCPQVALSNEAFPTIHLLEELHVVGREQEPQSRLARHFITICGRFSFELREQLFTTDLASFWLTSLRGPWHARMHSHSQASNAAIRPPATSPSIG